MNYLHILYSILAYVGVVVCVAAVIAVLYSSAKAKDQSKNNQKGYNTAASFFVIIAILLFFVGRHYWTANGSTVAAALTASSASSNSGTDQRIKKGKDYATQISNDTSSFSLPLLDASLNPKIDGQLWVQVASGHTDAEIQALGQEISKDYHKKVGFVRSDVMIVEDKPRLEVIFDAVAGGYEFKQQ